MLISDISVKRPVFAVVINLLIIAFGIVAFLKLPLREYPDIDPPIVSIETTYRGASANIIETRITELIEDRIAGIEGIKTINSTSQDAVSRISVEFDIKRNIDDAANDIRDRVSGIVDNLPEEADPPEIQKADSNDDVIIWLNLNGEAMSMMEITDYAKRYLVDRFSALDGVARVRIGGGEELAMRIWLDKSKMAARKVTITDIEEALNRQNIELPAGYIETFSQDFTLRIKRDYKDVQDFKNLVIKKGENNYLVRLGDLARIEVAAVEKRTLLRGNKIPMVGIGIIKQSKANTIEVARAAKREMQKINETLPNNMLLQLSYDTSVFIEGAVNEVYKTLFISIFLVILIIYLFLGSARAMIIPAVTVPVSLVGSFIAIYVFGYTLNLLTLLALVLAIGLVVDDAIVVIENIHRRIELGEPKLVAAFRGSRQVAFAVIATTMVLIAVFIPIVFLEGDIGRLFTEFVVAISSAVIFSSFVALTFSPMLSSKILQDKLDLEKNGKNSNHNKLSEKIDYYFEALKNKYLQLLTIFLNKPILAMAIVIFMMIASWFLIRNIPSELAPKEDRGAFFMFIKGPEGASYNYTLQYINEIEERLMPFVESGEFRRLLMRAPGSFGSSSAFNDAIGIVVLEDWQKRKPINYYLSEIHKRTSDISGVFVFPVVRQSFGGNNSKPVQFVLGGSTYEELIKWRDIIMQKASENKNLVGLDYDFKETKPQIEIDIKNDLAGDLSISTFDINSALETLFGTKKVTTFIDNGEEYDVILEAEKDQKDNISDINNIYVRSGINGEMIPLANLITINSFADATKFNRYNRLRSITLEANLAPGYSLGEALNYLENLVKSELPTGAKIDYKGESLDFKESGSQIYFIFFLAIVILFLVLAGQFESFVHPFIIILTVPLAVTGALFSLWLFNQTFNIYSQIGLIILIGIAAKNGILIVEFINQLRDEGLEFRQAILEASAKRLRPIIMTGLTTAIGSIPLILSFGAGAETRKVIGIVIFTGVIISMIFTIFIIPMIYNLMAKNTTSPNFVANELENLLTKTKDHK